MYNINVGTYTIPRKNTIQIVRKYKIFGRFIIVVKELCSFDRDNVLPNIFETQVPYKEK